MKKCIRCIFLLISCALFNVVNASTLDDQHNLTLTTNPTTYPTTYNVALIQGDFISRLLFQSLEQPLNMAFNFEEYKNFPDVVETITHQPNYFAANITYTDERARHFHISSPTNIVLAYFYSKNIAFEDAKLIGVPQNSFFIKIAKNEGLDVSFIEYETTAEASNLLESRAIDGVVDTMYALEKYLNLGYQAETINDKVSIPPVSIVSSSNIDPKQLEKMALLLQEDQTQKQFRKAIEDHQFRLRKNAILKEAKKLNIDLSQPIKIQLDIHQPLVYHTDTGELVGVSADITQKICRIMEANCQFIVDPDASWQDLYTKLENHQIDMLTPMIVSKPRQQLFNFTNPHHSNKVVVVKRFGYKDNTYQDLPELILERVGAIKGSYFEYILKRALPNKELIIYDTFEDQIQALINKEVDYILVNDFDYHLTVKNNQDSLSLDIDSYFTQSHTVYDAFAFPKTERGEKLVHLFNLALDMINTPAIAAQYDTTPDWMLIINAQKQSKLLMNILFAGSIFIITLFMYFLHRRSITDELTSLKNRRALYAKYASKGIKANVQLIYLDINNFKHINDTFGHHIGDKALIQLSQQIKQHWMGDAYRIGGDEFVLVAQYSKEALDAFLPKISQFTIKNDANEVLLMTSSIGIHHSETANVTLQNALHSADKAMYENKKQRYLEQLDFVGDRRKR